jgi:hypothetical protein
MVFPRLLDQAVPQDSCSLLLVMVVQALHLGLLVPHLDHLLTLLVPLRQVVASVVQLLPLLLPT